MVAHAGKGWRLAPSLIALEAEANLLAPRRSKRSDGSIGDLAHASRASDHNPAGGWVHGLDLTHDPSGGYDAHAQARRIAARRDIRINYIISNGMIWYYRTNQWQKYYGANKHTSHAHYSINRNAASRNNASRWHTEVVVQPPPPEVLPPTPTPELTPKATFEQGEMMKLLRDHNGNIWIWYNDDTRAHIPSMDEVKLWRDIWQLEYIDFGPGSSWHNPIVSQGWLNRIPVR